MARMHELSASPPYERVPNILRYTFNNFFIIYPLNNYFTINNASNYNIQDHPAFHFAIVNVKIISSALARYSCSREAPPIGAKRSITLTNLVTSLTQTFGVDIDPPPCARL